MRIFTCKPAAVAKLTRVSRLKRSIRPRTRSEMRGWVTPSRRAVSAWLQPWLLMWPLSAVISPERSFMFSAAAGDCSIAFQTLAYVLRFMTGFFLQSAIAACDQIKVTLSCFLRLLLETVENDDRLPEPCHINHPESSIRFANSYLANAAAHPLHRLPIVGLEAQLHAVELIARRPPCRLGECAQVIERAADKTDGLAIRHWDEYTKSYMLSSGWGMRLIEDSA